MERLKSLWGALESKTGRPAAIAVLICLATLVFLLGLAPEDAVQWLWNYLGVGG